MVSKNILGWASPLVIVALFIGYTFSPGHTNLDTISMLDQAHSGRFGTWHSPLVTGIWHLLGGQAWILPATLYLSIFAIVASAYIIFLQAGIVPKWACLLTILFCLVPSVLSGLSTVCKDTLTAALFLCSLILSVLYRQSRYQYPGAIRDLTFVLASCIRPEFILVAVSFILFEAVYVTRSIKTLLHGIAILLSCFLLNTITIKFENAANSHPEQQLFLNDVAYLSIAEHKLLIPEPFLNGTSLEILQKHYRDPTLDYNLFSYPKSEMLVYSANPKAVKKLRNIWINELFHHPQLFIWHRIKIFASYLWIGSYFQPSVDQNDYGLHVNHPVPDAIAVSYLTAFLHSPIQRHFVSMAGSLALIGLLLWKTPKTLFNRYLVVALACSVFYQMLVAIIGMNPTWRYGYAGVIVFWIGLGVACARLIPANRSSDQEVT